MKKISEKLQFKILPWLVATAFFMQMLDSSILNTALPSIAESFTENPLQMQMAVIAYMLSVVIFLPVSGWLADRFGTKKIFLTAIIIFTAGSLLCALSYSITSLSVSRIAQGIGGALLVPVGRLAVLKVYPRKQFVQVLSFITLPALIGPLIGPMLGGFLVQYASWHWIFLINIPVGILCFAAALYSMPKIATRSAPKFDWAGFIFFDSAVLLLFLFASKTTFYGISKTHIFLFAVILILLYCVRSVNKKDALFDMKMFGNKSFTIGIAGNFFARLAGGAMPFLSPLFLQTALNFSPLKAGITLLPMGLAAIFAKSLVTPVIKKLGYRKFLTANTIALGIFMASIVFVNGSTPYGVILFLFALFGMANSFQFTAVNTLSLIDLPDSMISGGNGILSVVMQVSMAMGVALAAFLLDKTAGLEIARNAAEQKLIFTFHSTYIIISIISVLSVLIFIFIPKDAGSRIKEDKTEKQGERIVPV